MKRTFFTSLIIYFSLGCTAQSRVLTLNLSETIEQAKTHSIKSLVATNSYIASYWAYRQYKASLLPSLSIGITPFQYNQNLTRRYDSQQNIDVYKSQQNLYSYLSISASQAFPFTGGTFILNSDLNFLKNFGKNGYSQFSTAPLRIGYSQKIFGHNSYKWSKKIEPKKFEKAKKELLYEIEDAACMATSYFYDLALQQKKLELCKDNVARCDTANKIAKERLLIGVGTRAQIHTLRLNLLNAQKALREAVNQVKQAQQRISSFLHQDKTVSIHVLPQKPKEAILIDPNEAISLAKDANPTILQMEIDILNNKQQIDQVKKNRYSSSLSASIGLNQYAESFTKAFNSPLHQESVVLSFNLPILDWGINKGKIIIAKQNLNAAILRNEQAIDDFEQKVIFTINQFHESYVQIGLSEEAEEAAKIAYYDTFQQFLLGKSDVDALGISQSRLNEASRDYINALANYWSLYYQIRKMTLYDFKKRTPIDINTNH